VTALALALFATGAQARTVLCFGDSTSLFYPIHLQQLRPDWQVVNGTRLGDVSSNIPRLTLLLRAHHPDVVIVMIGTNDVVRRPDGRPVVTLDPHVTVDNIRVLSRRARAAGARVLVLTQTPAACGRDCPDRQRHTREVAHRLVAWGLRPPPGIIVGDLRDELTIHSWAALSDDGLHPNQAGADLIARFVSPLLDAVAR